MFLIKSPFSKKNHQLHPILIVRHAESEANREKIWHGSTNGALSRRGEEQAIAAGLHLKEKYQISKIFVSDLTRAQRTAQLIAEQFSDSVDMVEMKALREIHLGDLEGESLITLVDRGFFNAHSKEKKVAFRAEGGESLDDVGKRMQLALNAILDGIGKNDQYLIVGHGVSLGLLLALALEQDVKNWPEFIVENATLSEFFLWPKPYMNAFNVQIC